MTQPKRSAHHTPELTPPGPPAIPPAPALPGGPEGSLGEPPPPRCVVVDGLPTRWATVVATGVAAIQATAAPMPVGTSSRLPIAMRGCAKGSRPAAAPADRSRRVVDACASVAGSSAANAASTGARSREGASAAVAAFGARGA